MMKCIFVESKIFEKYRDDYLSDEEFRLFQAELMSDPKQGDVIQGTGGLIKNDASIYSLFMGRVRCQI